MSVIGPMKKFDPLPIPFQSVPIKSVPIETESEKIGTRLIGIGIGVTRYLDAFPYTRDGIVHVQSKELTLEDHLKLMAGRMVEFDMKGGKEAVQD